MWTLGFVCVFIYGPFECTVGDAVCVSVCVGVGVGE